MQYFATCDGDSLVIQQTMEGKTQDEGDDGDDMMEPHRRKIMFELDGHETMGKSAFQKGDYNHAYNEYKVGLKACSDLIVGSDAKGNPDLMAIYKLRCRKFCVNAALACIKIHHWQQGLEACTLVLDEGADSDMQRVKALYRAGVCARGMGELDAAMKFFKRILEEEENVDERTVRDVKAQMKSVTEEGKRYKKFAQEMCNPTKEKNLETIIIPEKPELSEKGKEKLAEVEQKREEYLERKRKDKEAEERVKREGGARIVNKPEIEMTEDECIDALDYLAERYATPEVQEALKEVCIVTMFMCR